MKFEAVIFDFDYTLADSSGGAVECTNYSLKEMGLPVQEPEAIRKTIGLSLENTFRAFTGAEDKSLAIEFHRLYVERTDQVMLQYIRMFDSVKPATGIMLNQGLKLGIVSTKFRRRIEAFIARENLKHIFEVIVGGEDIITHKPDPAGLIIAMDRLRCSPETTIYIGDSVVDAQTARNAGTRFVAVLTGVTPQEDFAEFKPWAIIKDLNILPSVVGYE